MTAIPHLWLSRELIASAAPLGCLWENLLSRRTEAIAQLKDCEIIQNLILSLDYNDFKSRLKVKKVLGCHISPAFWCFLPLCR